MITMSSKTSRKEISMRPHHILCVNFFAGKGYSEEFTENMKEIISFLKANPNSSVELTHGADCICGCCPNNISGACNSDEKVRKYDDMVIKTCELTQQTYEFEYLLQTIKKKIIDKNTLHTICGDCSWFDFCGEQ